MVGSERTLVKRRVRACRSACRGDGERLGGQLVRLSASVRVGLCRREEGGLAPGTTVGRREDIGGFIRIWKRDKEISEVKSVREKKSALFKA